MPDIAMCAGTGCAVRNTCLRHIAKPTTHWQAWTNFWLDRSFNPATGCHYFMQVEPRRIYEEDNNDDGLPE